MNESKWKQNEHFLIIFWEFFIAQEIGVLIADSYLRSFNGNLRNRKMLKVRNYQYHISFQKDFMKKTSRVTESSFFLLPVPAWIGLTDYTVETLFMMLGKQGIGKKLCSLEFSLLHYNANVL